MRPFFEANDIPAYQHIDYLRLGGIESQSERDIASPHPGWYISAPDHPGMFPGQFSGIMTDDPELASETAEFIDFHSNWTHTIHRCWMHKEVLVSGAPVRQYWTPR